MNEEKNQKNSNDLEDEVSLLDVILFVKRNKLFLTWLTLLISGLTIAYSLFRPATYQKNIDFSVKCLIIDDSNSSDNNPCQLSNQFTNALVKYFENQPLPEATIKADYNSGTQVLNLTLKSTSAESLMNIKPQLLNFMANSLEKHLKIIISDKLGQSSMALDITKQMLVNLESIINQTPDSETLRKTALETERAKTISNQASLEAEQDYLQNADLNLQQFSEKNLPFGILSESEVQEIKKNPSQITILALLAGFMMAILVAIIREQLPKWKTELNNV